MVRQTHGRPACAQQSRAVQRRCQAHQQAPITVRCGGKDGKPPSLALQAALVVCARKRQPPLRAVQPHSWCTSNHMAPGCYSSVRVRCAAKADDVQPVVAFLWRSQNLVVFCNKRYSLWATTGSVPAPWHKVPDCAVSPTRTGLSCTEGHLFRNNTAETPASPWKETCVRRLCCCGSKQQYIKRSELCCGKSWPAGNETCEQLPSL